MLVKVLDLFNWDVEELLNWTIDYEEQEEEETVDLGGEA